MGAYQGLRGYRSGNENVRNIQIRDEDGYRSKDNVSFDFNSIG